jgi:hypothetical protein
VTVTADTRYVDSPLGHIALCNVPALGKSRSEDLVDTAGSAAWLLDGASAYDDRDACQEHDALWFVQHLSRALAVELTNGTSRTLRDTLATAIARVNVLHGEFCPRQVPGHGPSATALIVRRINDALEYLVLGDSALIVQTHDGQVHHHSDKRLSNVHPRDRALIRQALRNGCGYDDAGHRERIRNVRAAERSMRNRPSGYWIAGDDPRAAHHSLVGSYSLDTTPGSASRIALISDGVERAVTHLQC